MTVIRKTIIVFLAITVFFTTGFFCCCERAALADSCHHSNSSSHHCHQSVSEHCGLGVQLSTLADSHKCNCEKIVTNRNIPKLDISISNNFQSLQKSFTIAKSFSFILTSFSSSALHGPPIRKFSSTPLYLQFSNLRI